MSSFSENIDLRLILIVPLGQFAPWLAAVLLVTWAGYPGVICVTPMAWLIALRVGIVCVARSTSARSSQRLVEAALAGGWFGLLQGLLFGIFVPFMGDIQPTERTSAAVLSLIMLAVGILAGVGFSVFTAFLVERRREVA
jgi:hypothetical protein